MVYGAWCMMYQCMVHECMSVYGVYGLCGVLCMGIA
jgi:hypothetical protein